MNVAQEGSGAMHEKDLTQGPVMKTMALFALPMILGNIMQQMYNIVDTWVVGRFVGADALAAVGSAFALMTFLTSILLGLCMGGGVVFSLCIGQRDETRLEDRLRGAFGLTALIAVLLTLAALFSTDVIIRWLNIPLELREMTGLYLTIVFCGIPGIFLYNFFASYLKALGDSVVPLAFLGISTGSNVFLDLLFVVGFRLGAGGAAAATITAQYLAGFGISIYTLKKDRRVRKALSSRGPSWDGLREIVSYSLLTCIQQSVMNLGILMVQGLVNSFGTTVMAAFAAATKIDAFAYMPAQEYGNAFSTFIAQNMGAGEKARVKQGFRYALCTSITYCILVSLLLWFLAGQLMGVFVDPGEKTIIMEGVRYLHIEGVFYCGIGCLFLLYGLYRAMGRPGISVVLTVISLGTRVLLSYTLSRIPGVGVLGIWWSIPIGWALADLAGLLYFAMKKDRLLCGMT